jgi:TPR repeat protein
MNNKRSLFRLGFALAIPIQLAFAAPPLPDVWSPQWSRDHAGYTKSQFCADAAQSNECTANSQECVDAYMKAYLKNNWACAGIVYPDTAAERDALTLRLKKKYSTQSEVSVAVQPSAKSENNGGIEGADPLDVWAPNWRKPSNNYGSTEFCADAAQSAACTQHSNACTDDYQKAYLKFGWTCAGVTYPGRFTISAETARLEEKYRPQMAGQHKQELAQAFEETRMAAEKGDVQAQIKLAEMYAQGRGVDQSFQQALTWDRKAADKGSDDARVAVGAFYSEGWGVPKDYTQALGWFRKAADHGNASAQFIVGNCYRRGLGVKQDDKQALAWYRKSADQGYVGAQSVLGSFYSEGRGVTKDSDQAMVWYRKAADQGDRQAQYALGDMYSSGPANIRDYGQAMSLYQKAANQGHTAAEYRMGVLYENGWGVSQDYPQAIAWYHKAADQGYSWAQTALGWLYENGQGVAQDYGQAMAWYRKAADQGNANAQNTLGALVYRVNVANDPVQAMSWFRKAADQGDADAEYNVGSLYEAGKGVPPDLQMARFWYQKAANQGLAAAKDAIAGVSKPGGTITTSYDRNVQAIIAKQQASASTGRPQQQSQASAAQDAKRQQIADLQSKIRDLKDDAETSEQAAEGFDQEGQVLQGPGGAMARGLATQKRTEVQRINRQINDLQDQLQAIQSQPVPADPPNAAPSTRASMGAAGAVPAVGAAKHGGSGTSSVASTASACWSPELDQVNDPVVRARMGDDVVQKTIEVAQTSGTAGLDQQIAQMQDMQQQAEKGIRAANADISAIAQGSPPQVNPRICATMRASGEPSAIMAAMCQRLTMQNMLHLANGLVEVTQCVRQATQ